MILSLLYRAARTMVSIPAVLLRRDTAKDAELLVLRHENTVLRRQLKGPVRYEWADRFWLSVLSSLIPRRRWADAFPVTLPHTEHPKRLWTARAVSTSPRSGSTERSQHSPKNL
jgi:hypothetical protein